MTPSTGKFDQVPDRAPHRAQELNRFKGTHDGGSKFDRAPDNAPDHDLEWEM